VKRLLLTLVLAACSKATPPVVVADAAPPPGPDAAPAVPLYRPVQSNGLTWYEDQPEAALAAARAARKPVFLDLWAPWCPPCLQMRAFVLTRPNLGELADQFVWLSINVERAANVPFNRRYPHQGLPTFYVIEPDDGTVLARLLGSAPIPDVRALLSDTRRVRERLHAGGLDAKDPVRALITADIAVAQGKLPEAAAAYQVALEYGGPSWPRRAPILAARGELLGRMGEQARCVTELLPELASAAASAAYTLSLAVARCAERLPAQDPSRQAALVAARTTLVALCMGDDLATVSADDRATACRWGWWAQEQTGDKKGAKVSATRRLVQLARAVEGLGDELAQADDHMLVETLSYLGRDQEAIAIMKAREAALPASYNPPASLAELYQDLKQWDLALAAIDRALALAYGPQKVAFMQARAEILWAAGQQDQATRELGAADATFAALPAAQQSSYRKHELARTRAKLGGRPPGK
jgi:thioredoxin-like negative regulator of GroEL